MKNVSFQGERGAYSEAAAKSFFKNDIKTIPLATFAEILEKSSSVVYSSYTNALMTSF